MKFMGRVFFMLKKSFLVCCVFVCFCFLWAVNGFSFMGFNALPFENFSVSNSSLCKITSCESYSKLKLDGKLDFSKVGGSFLIEKELDLQELLKSLSVKTVFYEATEFGESLYGYSNKIAQRKTVNGKVVNIQVFIGKNQRITVGIPLIYGSY